MVLSDCLLPGVTTVPSLKTGAEGHLVALITVVKDNQTIQWVMTRSTFLDPSFGLLYSWSLCGLFSTIPLLSFQAHGRITLMLSCPLWSYTWPCDLSRPMKCEQKPPVSHLGSRFKSQSCGCCGSKCRYGLTGMRRAPCRPMTDKYCKWAINVHCGKPLRLGAVFVIAA